MPRVTPAALRRTTTEAARTMSAFIPAAPLTTTPAPTRLARARRAHCTRRAPPDDDGASAASRTTPTMIRGFPNDFNNNPPSSSVPGQRIFDRLVDFPCVFTFKIIGVGQGNFVNDIIDSVALALNTERKYLKTSFRHKGKYQSITVDAPVNTADQIYSVYAAIDRDPRVKFKF